MDGIRLSHLTKVERRGMLLQISDVGQDEGKMAVPLAVETVLQKFNGVFEKPKGLPPKRSHDHPIILKEGIAPISVHPYRYPFYKKSEIKKNNQ